MGVGEKGCGSRGREIGGTGVREKGMKGDLVQCQKRPSTVSKET
jgi:hypothetical protein